MTDELRADLTTRLLGHCALACVTGEEGPLADAVAARYAVIGRPVTRIGHSVVVGAPDDRPLVLLVGHLDVVPPTDDDREPRIEERDGTTVVVARGASDMKSGNVVAMRLAETCWRSDDGPYAVALVLYAGEEGPAETNELPTVLDQVAWLGDAALAVVLEPTDGEVQLGCLGGLHAHVTFTGRAAHSARPWHGTNALTAAGRFLGELDARAPVEVTVDGIAYHDVWSATQAWTDNARNVIPDRFTINLNLRFAPSRELDVAETELRTLVAEIAGGDVGVTIVDRAPPAPPDRGDPTVAAFLDAVGGEVRGKQAWTDVARFAAVGVPALNLGPGATAQAHRRGEEVAVDALVEVHDRLAGFLGLTGAG